MDENDNAPEINHSVFVESCAEDAPTGTVVALAESGRQRLRRERARDADAGANGRVSYWLAGGSAGAAGAAPPVSVEARSGALYAQRSFDYERCREFAVAVRAQDGGAPARSSTATVRVFVLDRNDNAPRVLWPAAAAGEAAGAAASPFEVFPRARPRPATWWPRWWRWTRTRGATRGCRTSWCRRRSRRCFRVGLHSGEVRTARAVSERDAAKQRLVAVVKDHGQPALSATATLHVVLAESLQEALPELSERAAGAEAPAAELHFYLGQQIAMTGPAVLDSVTTVNVATVHE
ncbi:hypothetical protein DUI87_30595 [Hirundo rustica rustica]|uniref:Cadherin domain-containing protein n=1 Tax=Hirundo rustica rustica TaxID=333673 RepID=A0A3M0J2R6_HIRRU|nr:hypothetical protein DUI87_30595 [Hirundo rustica rustica]